MKTVLYDTLSKQIIGAIRNGRYLVDGKPATLPNNIVELEVDTLPIPPYDVKIQAVEYKLTIDLNNLKAIEWYDVRNLDKLEMENKTKKSTKLFDLKD